MGLAAGVWTIAHVHNCQKIGLNVGICPHLQGLAAGVRTIAHVHNCQKIGLNVGICPHLQSKDPRANTQQLKNSDAEFE